MKKIKVLLAVVAVVAMLSTVAFAADSAVNFGADAVAYTDGQDLVISIYSAVDEEIGAARYIYLTYDKSVWSYSSFVAGVATATVADYPNDGEMEVYTNPEGTATVTAGQKIVDIKFTKKDGATAVGSAFEFDNDGYYRNASGTKLAYEGTITVVAAGPTIAEETVEADVSVNKDSIFVGDQEYTNVAVYTGAIAFPELATGESLTTAGIKYDGTSVYTFPSISGGGNVEYKVLFYGITADQADALGAKIKTYYTGNFIQE